VAGALGLPGVESDSLGAQRALHVVETTRVGGHSDFLTGVRVEDKRCWLPQIEPPPPLGGGCLLDLQGGFV
jgi:hypothetical protein